MYKSLVRPLLFQCSPEWIHHVSLAALRVPFFHGAIRDFACADFPSLERELWGIRFRNPVGLAAGFDKNGAALGAWEDLGFGFAEIGTVTRHAQPGNPKPRVFRVSPSEGLINRLGFPNLGAEAVAASFQKVRDEGGWPTIPIGINIGKSKVTSLEDAGEDTLFSFKLLRAFGDFFVINVSSPNTPGLRELQHGDYLRKVLEPVITENRKGREKPVLLKIAPDLTDEQLARIVECAQSCGIHGIVATNTTIDKSSVALKEEGGLSGRPLRYRSTEVIRKIRALTDGKLPIIGVGGIFTAEDAREKLDAGASLVQLYTGFVYEGPLVVRKICEGLKSINR